MSANLKIEALTDVPPERVGKLRDDFKADGAIKVETESQPNGKVKVIAYFALERRAKA